jgi:hypothetical protein
MLLFPASLYLSFLGLRSYDKEVEKAQAKERGGVATPSE